MGEMVCLSALGPAAPISERVDIWALGCLLFTLLYMSHPFQGEASLAIANARFSFPDEAEGDAQAGKDFGRGRPHMSALKDLVCWLLARDPQSRPSASQLLQALSEVGAGRPVPLPEAIAALRRRQRQLYTPGGLPDLADDIVVPPRRGPPHQRKEKEPAAADGSGRRAGKEKHHRRAAHGASKASSSDAFDNIKWDVPASFFEQSAVNASCPSPSPAGCTPPPIAASGEWAWPEHGPTEGGAASWGGDTFASGMDAASSRPPEPFGASGWPGQATDTSANLGGGWAAGSPWPASTPQPTLSPPDAANQARLKVDADAGSSVRGPGLPDGGRCATRDVPMPTPAVSVPERGWPNVSMPSHVHATREQAPFRYESDLRCNSNTGATGHQTETQDSDRLCPSAYGWP